MKVSKTYWTCLGLLCAVLISGCSAAAAPTPNSESQDAVAAQPQLVRPVNVETIRGGASYDYDIQPSITAVAKRSRYVVSGVVESWQAGREFVDLDSKFLFAVMTVSVQRTYKAPSRQSLEQVRVLVARGSVFVKPDGSTVKLPPGARYNQRTIAELQEAVPAGSRVIVLAGLAQSLAAIATEPGKRVTVGDRLPPDSVLLGPAPQGLLFAGAKQEFLSGIAEQRDFEFAGMKWPRGNNSFDALLAELRRTKG